MMPPWVSIMPAPVTLHSSEYNQFLEHLRATRKASGLTQEQVAQRLGKPQSYVSKTMNGERRMDLIEILAFCDAIEKPAVDFVAEFVAELVADVERGKSGP